MISPGLVLDVDSQSYGKEPMGIICTEQGPVSWYLRAECQLLQAQPCYKGTSTLPIQQGIIYKLSPWVLSLSSWI